MKNKRVLVNASKSHAPSAANIAQGASTGDNGDEPVFRDQIAHTASANDLSQGQRPQQATVQRQAPASQIKKRKILDNVENDELLSERQPKKYQMIRERIRRIPIAVMESKWRTLPQSAQDQVHELLQMAKRSLLNREDGRRNSADVRDILQKTARRLEDNERKVRFPVQDVHFDLEKLNDQNVRINPSTVR